MTDEEFAEQRKKRYEAYIQGLYKAKDIVISLFGKTQKIQERNVILEIAEKLRNEAKRQEKLLKEK